MPSPTTGAVDAAHPRKSIHGHTGPTTPAEDGLRGADARDVPPGEQGAVAEAASREEDA